MRIAVVNNFFPPRPGGSSHLSDHLARGYAAAGHEVLVLTASYAEAPSEEVVDGVRIVRVPAWTLPKTRLAANFDIGFTISPRSVRAVFRTLDAFRPDVVHQHGQFFDLTWISGLWARVRRIPTLLSVHTRLETPLSRFNHFVYWLADMLVVVPMMWLHKPDIVVMDNLMDSYVTRRYGRAHRRRVPIPVGIDPDRFAGGDGVRVRAELGLGDRPTIVSIGHVIPQRSRIALAQALPAIVSALPDIAVVVVGGVYHDEFLKVAGQLGVRDHIITVGCQPQTAVADYLAAADVEVHELEGLGFGTASLEALATGIPVVAAARADNFVGVELKHQYHLYLAPFQSPDQELADVDGLAEVLVEVLRNPAAARAEVSENARALVAQNFTIGAVTRAHLDHLETMTARRGEPVLAGAGQ